MSEFFESVVAELHARTQIQDVLMRHSRGIDRNDHFGARLAAFHPDAVINAGHGRQPLQALLATRSRQHEHTLHTMHIVTNVVIDFCSPTVAVVESYVQAIELEGSGYDFGSRGIENPGVCGARIFSWCRYVDIVTHRSDEWRILERTVVFGDTHVQPIEREVALPPGFVQQHHGADDPLYEVHQHALDLARSGETTNESGVN